MSTHNTSKTLPPSSQIKTMRSIHGVNPKNLVEKIVRMKIQGHPYWKEKCIGLNEESLIDRAMDMDSFGGTFGGNKQPTHFLCLMLKMLQIQPEQDIILEYIKDETSKYLRLLGAFYLRLVGKPRDIYTCLEPLYNDYRTVRKRVDSGYEKIHIDVFIKELLTTDYACDIALPHLPPRATLEHTISLPKRISPLVENNLIDIEKIKQEEKEKILTKINEQNESLKVMKIETASKNTGKKINDKMDVDEKHKDNKDENYKDDRKRDDKQDDRGERFRDDRYGDKDDRYRSERYRDDRYRDNRYGDRPRDDRHRDDRYRDDRYRDDRYRDDRYRDGYDKRNEREYGERYRDDKDYEKKRDRYNDSESDEEGSISTSKQEQDRPKKKINISKYEKGNKVESMTTSTVTSEKDEIAKMNEIRKKIGLPPLKE